MKKVKGILTFSLIISGPATLVLAHGEQATGTCECGSYYDDLTGFLGCFSCDEGCFKTKSKESKYSFICRACLPGCKTCVNSDSCGSCKPGYYASGKICKKCSTENCDRCSNEGCSLCLTNFFFTEQECQRCFDSNCNSCTSEMNCVECKDGFYPDGKDCKPCVDSSCMECSSEYRCEKCEAKNQFISGAYCESCPKHCKRCSNLNSCENCADYHEWNPDTLACESIGFFRKVWRKFRGNFQDTLSLIVAGFLVCFGCLVSDGETNGSNGSGNNRYRRGTESQGYGEGRSYDWGNCSYDSEGGGIQLAGDEGLIDEDGMH